MASIGPGFYARIAPIISWSWNMAGRPAGDTWYEPRRTVHEPQADTRGSAEGAPLNAQSEGSQ